MTRNGTHTVTYAYDANGNRLTRAVNGAVVETGVYDAQDRVETYAGRTYTYTANGELHSVTAGSATTTYAYDVLGNLRQVTQPDGTVIQYLVDGQNRRIGRRRIPIIGPPQERYFLWEDGLRPAAELDASGAVVARYVYGTRVNVPEYIVRPTGSEAGTYRIVTDHLGSPRLVVNVSTGGVVQRLAYDEFGRVLHDTRPGWQPFGFAGGIADDETGYVRFGLRDYDAQLGRWLARDPIRFEGGDTNLFGYGTSDPVNVVDPSGLVLPQVIGAVIGGAYGYYTGGAQGLVVGLAAGALSTTPFPLLARLLGVPISAGLVSGSAAALGSVALQLWGGISLGCLNWDPVVLSALAGFGGGALGAAVAAWRIPSAYSQYAASVKPALTDWGQQVGGAVVGGVAAAAGDAALSAPAN